MSSRLTYANGAALLTDFVLECGQGKPDVPAEEAAIEYIAAWLADGKSMKALCEQYGLNWGVTAAWIRGDPVRDARYRQAMTGLQPEQRRSDTDPPAPILNNVIELNQTGKPFISLEKAA